MKKKCILLGILILTVGILTACKAKPIDLAEYIKIDFDGYDTVGTATVTFNAEKLVKDNLKAFELDKDSKRSAISKAAEKLTKYISVVPDTTGRLTNGDSIELEWDVNEERIKEKYGLTLIIPDEEYTVKGLTELREYDAFGAIEVSFEGYDGYGSVYCYNNCIYPLYYSFDWEDGLKNGDRVTASVSAYDSSSVDEMLASEGLRLTSTVKEYTVSGLKELEAFSPFDRISLEYTGMSGSGSVSVCNWNDLYGLDFTCDRYYDLSNGDTVTVTVSYDYGDIYEYCAEYGYFPEELSQTYILNGFKSYISDVSQIPDDALDEMSNSAIDDYMNVVYNSWSMPETLLSMQYTGNYFVTGRDSYDNNMLYLIFEQIIQRTSDPTQAFRNYYYVCFYNLIADSNGDIIYDSSDCTFSKGHWENSEWIGEGYIADHLGYDGFPSIEAFEDAHIAGLGSYYNYTKDIFEIPFNYPGITLVDTPTVKEVTLDDLTGVWNGYFYTKKGREECSLEITAPSGRMTDLQFTFTSRGETYFLSGDYAIADRLASADVTDGKGELGITSLSFLVSDDNELLRGWVNEQYGLYVSKSDITHAENLLSVAETKVSSASVPDGAVMLLSLPQNAINMGADISGQFELGNGTTWTLEETSESGLTSFTAQALYNKAEDDYIRTLHTRNASCVFGTNGRYTVFSTVLAPHKSSTPNSISQLRVFFDGRLAYESSYVEYNSDPFGIELDITGVVELTVEIIIVEEGEMTWMINDQGPCLGLLNPYVR